MARGNFSNKGRDTFDAMKQYIGVRLQQGVPLLDRDWNELEDIRRYFERSLRRAYVGPGVPDATGFAISAPETAAPGDFRIGAGRAMVDGYDILNPREILFSEQSGVEPLPDPARDEILTVFVTARVERVDGDTDAALLNAQDVNIETCVRDRLAWTVGVARHPSQPPAGALPLARIRRPAGQARITAEMISDLRRTDLNLARTVDETSRLRGDIGTLTTRIEDIQQEIERIKLQLARLFWEVEITVPRRAVYFGSRASLRVRVRDGLGTPIFGAQLAVTADWGVLDPATAVTDRNGRATIELLGVHAETPPRRSEVAVLERAVKRVDLVAFQNPGTIEYARLRFEPDEMMLISKYSPPSTFLDLSHDLPMEPIVAQPSWRTATVTVHASEGEGGIVRGVGSQQVRFGLWVRDWARTKVLDVVSRVSVGARVGDMMRRGIVDEAFDQARVMAELPGTMQEINDDTYSILGSNLFVRTAAGREEVLASGSLGQAIAQEATAAVGSKTNDAIAEQIDRFTDSDSVRLDREGGRQAKTRVVQSSSQIAAGFAQDAKQRFTIRKGFR